MKKILSLICCCFALLLTVDNATASGNPGIATVEVHTAASPTTGYFPVPTPKVIPIFTATDFELALKINYMNGTLTKMELFPDEKCLAPNPSNITSLCKNGSCTGLSIGLPHRANGQGSIPICLKISGTNSSGDATSSKKAFKLYYDLPAVDGGPVSNDPCISSGIDAIDNFACLYSAAIFTETKQIFNPDTGTVHYAGYPLAAEKNWELSVRLEEKDTISIRAFWGNRCLETTEQAFNTPLFAQDMFNARVGQQGCFYHKTKLADNSEVIRLPGIFCPAIFKQVGTFDWNNRQPVISVGIYGMTVNATGTNVFTGNRSACFQVPIQ